MPLNHPVPDRGRSLLSRSLVITAAFLLIWSCRPGNSGEVTPSGVYQVVETINGELSALLAASGGYSGPVVDRPLPTRRQPRHVLQKAREVMLKVQVLRAENGLPETQLPPFPTTEATPADSKLMVTAILRDVLDLRSKFNVTTPVLPAPEVAGKTPTDVYAGLQRASDTLDALGVPRTMPNDVCRLAVMINEELEGILVARKRTQPAFIAAPGTGSKTPEDVYAQAYTVLDRLRAKVEADPGLTILGGIVLPNRRDPPLTPNDILDLENSLLAELGAIEATLGIASRIPVPPLIRGRTPSDIFDLLARAQALVAAL
jgi:hypothetical protein